MAVTQRLRVTCPRCATPVTGDFKYCPACAFRLKLGTLEAPLPPARVGLSAWLLGVGAIALLAGLVSMGVVLFREREGPTGSPPPPLPRVSAATLTIASLPGFMRTLDEGIADYVYEQEAGELVARPRYVLPLKVLAFEVTRRLFAEYLADLAERVQSGGRPGETLLAIWDAREPAQIAYAQSYLMEWLEAFLRHANERGLAREEALEPLLQYLPEDERRPGLKANDIAVRVPFPWPPELGLLTAAPPSWAYVNRFGLVVSAVPEGTEHLPVTEVAWTDANAFAMWAREELGGDLRLRLPVEGEWLRIAHSNHPPAPPDLKIETWDFPWGNEPLVRACNNRLFWPEGFPPRLQSVDWRYLDENRDRRMVDDMTRDGVFGMSGNAREWAFPDQVRPLRVGQRLLVHWDESTSSDGMAPTRGGSYLLGLSDCTVTSRVSEPMVARREDIGFRLVASIPY